MVTQKTPQVCCSKHNSFLEALSKPGSWAVSWVTSLGKQEHRFTGWSRSFTLHISVKNCSLSGVGLSDGSVGKLQQKQAHLSGVWWWRTVWLHSPAGSSHLSSQPCSRQWLGTGLSLSEAERGETKKELLLFLPIIKGTAVLWHQISRCTWTQKSGNETRCVMKAE